jgi:hypothetical protein
MEMIENGRGRKGLVSNEQNPDDNKTVLIRRNSSNRRVNDQRSADEYQAEEIGSVSVNDGDERQWREERQIPRQQEETRKTDNSQSDTKSKHRFWIGFTAIALIAASIWAGDMSGTQSLKDVQSTGIGHGMKAGVVLASTDDSNGLEARDYKIEMKADTDASRAMIWDFAAEDGDVVTVKANGSVIAENVRILHAPVIVNIPVPSTVEVIGVKDGGGGITYGIKFAGSAGNSAYFNAAPEGSANVYTVVGP